LKRLAVLAVAAVVILGACEKDTAQKSGGTVKPASSTESTATTATTASGPSTTAATSKATTTTTAKATTSTTARATTTTTFEDPTTTTVAKTVSYSNCTAAKAAGAAPLYRGDPGYSSKLDRDGDGIACES